MEWIKTILPLIGVLLGWLLAESGKIFTDKRQDKRKLKKLLFFLLELRYHFAKELSMELDLDKYLIVMKNKLADKLGIDKSDPEFNIGLDAWKPFLKNLISKTKLNDDKFEYLAKNIDGILIELAEIFPIIAYELSGQHNIKERLNKVSNYFKEAEEVTNELPFDIQGWIKPKLTKELLDDLDESINKIASKIDKDTKQNVREKISDMTFDNDDSELETFIDEYLGKLEESMT
jgi:vacuolar-type H+-ATPase subunit H